MNSEYDHNEHFMVVRGDFISYSIPISYKYLQLEGDKRWLQYASICHSKEGNEDPVDALGARTPIRI